MMTRHLARIAAVCFALLMACSSNDDKGNTEADHGVAPADGGGDLGPAEDVAVEPDGTGPAPDAASVPTEGPLAQQNLERITGYLASDDLQGREEGSPGGAAARKFIIEELTKCGVKPAGEGGTFEQKITAGKGTNILGLIEGTGTDEAKRKVLISAHYDHLGVKGTQVYNGAYDNAAAVALLIGVACELAKAPPLRSILVASWDAEEPDTFLSPAMGSQYYVDHPLVPLDEIDVAIVLDLIAGDLWAGAGLHFAVGAEKCPEVYKAVDAVASPAGLKTYRLGMHLVEEQPLGHQPWGDYDAFRNAGVPFLFLTDGQTKVYHTPNDEMKNLVKSKLPLEAAYLRAIVDRLANAPASQHAAPVFEAKGNDYASDAKVIVAVLEQALVQGGIVESLKLSPTSRTKLQADLQQAKQIEAKLAGGTSPADADVITLRRAVQRVMCLAGSSYEEVMCGMF